MALFLTAALARDRVATGLDRHNSAAEGANQYQYHKDRDAFGVRQLADPFSCFVKFGAHDVHPALRHAHGLFAVPFNN